MTGNFEDDIDQRQAALIVRPKAAGQNFLVRLPL